MASTKKSSSEFNLTTALMLLVMLMVVIISLLAYMLFDEQRKVTELMSGSMLYCVPVSPTPAPTGVY